MKQLTKEQHEAIYEWLKKGNATIQSEGIFDKKAIVTSLAAPLFVKEFEAACCDSCADGEHCESDHKEKSIDRIPEETSEQYINRVATINGRK